jgi:hypothetical protein
VQLEIGDDSLGVIAVTPETIGGRQIFELTPNVVIAG